MIRPILNFKPFRWVECVRTGIELMHMIRNNQFVIDGADTISFAHQFYAFAGKIRTVWGKLFRSR